ncbi:MAG: hypothetical protein KF708_22765 [Pirellulales bacterium]|nr:hypothetical protein [Pirellulales bacterium]
MAQRHSYFQERFGPVVARRFEIVWSLLVFSLFVAALVVALLLTGSGARAEMVRWLTSALVGAGTAMLWRMNRHARPRAD